MSNKKGEMKKIYEDVNNLVESPLYDYRVKSKYLPVIGEGSHDAKLMLIGEAPGRNEAETGKPFCGKSGKILDELLNAIQLPRNEVYITSIVKDRPENNRDPLPVEIALYSPFLDRQIDIIQPQVIATLGRFSMKYLMEKFGLSDKIKPIGELHGKVFEISTSYGKVWFVPLYHPAVAVYNRNTKKILLKDFKLIKKYI
jgi:uracil-DNA glycosylase